MSQYSTKYPGVSQPIVHLFGEKFVDLTSLEKWGVPDKIVVKAAVTGAIFDREQNPNQPYSTAEILEEAISCVDAGACSVHLHVRDEEGNITADRKYYREVIDPLRETYGDRVHLDGETVFGETFEDALIPITEGLFDSAAMNTTATYFGDSLIAIPPDFLKTQSQVVQEHNRKAQIAVYNLGDIDNAHRFLIKPGILKEPYEWLVVPGNPGCCPMGNERMMCESLLSFVNRIREVDPSERPFIVVCSGGRATSYLTGLAIILGLHVRVGMEDTVWKYPHKDDLLTGNSDVVLSTIEMARLLGREPATADEYRRMVGIK